jgi:mono/diheme cytochrome c family protein
MAASTAGSQILLRGSVEETMTKVAGLAASAGVGAGAELFRENNCFACHRLGNAGGDLGPDLTHVGARLPRPIIEAILDHKLEEERRGRR